MSKNKTHNISATFPQRSSHCRGEGEVPSFLNLRTCYQLFLAHFCYSYIENDDCMVQSYTHIIICILSKSLKQQ